MFAENKKNDGSLTKSKDLEKRIRDLEKSENKLKGEKEYLESLISNSLDCIVQSDAKGVITSVNRAFVDMTGFEREEIIGRTPAALAPPEEGEYESVTGKKVQIGKKFFDKQKEFVEKLFENGALNNLNTAVLRKDRKIVPVEENIFLLYDKKGAVVASAAIIRNMTERRKNEEELKRHRDNLDELVIERTQKLRSRELQLSEVNARLRANDQKLKSANEQLAASNQQLLASEESLRESEKSFRRLVETMNEGLIVMDDTGEISYVNEKICVMTGYERDELQGFSIEDFFDKEDEKLKIIMDSVLSSGGGVHSGSYEIEWLTKDKNKMPVIISPESIIDEDSKFAGIFAVITDITTIKEAESKVRESRDFLENIFTTTRDGIVVTDVTGAIIRINNSVERIFGFTKDEMIDRYLTEFIPKGEKYKIVGRGFSDELKEKGFLDIFETFFMKKNGDIAPFECNITVLKDEKGQAAGAVAMLRDITGRKKMEQQFLQTEKLSSLGELAGGVAHDFNNMLSAILGRTQLLMMRISKAEKNKDIEKLLENISESLKVIEKASLDGADTVHRIMKFARKEKTGESILVNINDIINDAIEFTRPRWKAQSQSKGISFDIKKDFCGSSSYVSGVASELREVITNILINAFDAMPDGGEVFIRSYTEEGFAVAEISDTGTGIEQEALDKIFDPFFTTKGPKSTGLGMSVSYGIIEQHGGAISVNSHKNEKTIFTIRLPLSEGAVVKTKKVLPVLKQKKINILIIEDEKAVSEMFEELLISEGHEVAVACDGNQGLDIFRKKKFDLVFTDLAMPGISGWQVAKEIKKIDAAVPVILTTGYEIKSSEEDADKKNVDIIIKKPFTVSRIIEVILEALKKKRQGL